MAKGKKKRSMAYILRNVSTGTQYVIRMSRDAFDKLKKQIEEKGGIQRYDRKTKQHESFSSLKPAKK